MYKEIYYWFYRLQSSGKSKMKDTAEFAPMLIVIVIQYFNIAAIGIIVKHYFGLVKILIEQTYIKPIGILIFVILFVINHLFIYRKRQYIFDKYNAKSKNRKMIGVAITICFIVFSILLPLKLSEKLESPIQSKTDLQIQTNNVSLDTLYYYFTKTHNYKYLRLYYKEINELIEKNPENTGFRKNLEMLELVYGDSLKVSVKEK